MGVVRLLTAPPGTGKTTALWEYAKKKANVGGWICPDFSSWRMMVSFPGETWEIFQSESQEYAACIGRFYFRNELFEYQRNRIRELQFNAKPQCSEWIIDEVGPLELRSHGGWTLLLQDLLNLDAKESLNFNLLVVVRMGYESAFQQQWPFKNMSVIPLEAFSKEQGSDEVSDFGTSLTGLVLAGGKSTRMGQNKAMLKVDGHPLYRRTALMLSPACRSVYLSVHALNMTDYPDWPCLYDDLNLRAEGPLTALLSAWQHLPQSNWLLSACDYPQLNSTMVRILTQSAQLAYPTAFLADDGRANPLFAYYPSFLYPELKKFYAEGGKSLRVFLENYYVQLISYPLTPQSIDTPQQWNDVTGKQLPYYPL